MSIFVLAMASRPTSKFDSTESRVFYFPPDNRESPSSSTSSSRLLPDRQGFSPPPPPGSRDHRISHHARSQARREELHNARHSGLNRKMPSPVLGDLPRSRPVVYNVSYDADPQSDPPTNLPLPGDWRNVPDRQQHQRAAEWRNSDVFLPSDTTSVSENKQSTYLARG